MPCFWNSSQLAEQLAIIANLGFVGRRNGRARTAPSFPASGRGLVEHPVGPPIGHAVGFENAGAQPVEELVDDGLQAAVAGGLHLDAERFAFLLGQVGDGGAAGRKRFQAGIVNAGFVERRQVAGVGAFKANQAGDGLRGRHFRQRLDFLRGSAESGALQQVRREIVIPVCGADGRQIVLPGGGSGGLGE